MDRDVDIREKQGRVIDVFRKKPGAALSTVKATGHLDKGLACTVRQGDHQAVMDMSRMLGGDDLGPTLGFSR